MSHNLDKVYVVDFESNGLVSEATKIWTMGIGWQNKEGNWVVKSTTDYNDMKKVLGNPENTIVCHNLIRFDVPLYEKIIGEKVQASLVDSLGLSWYLYPERGQAEHGLAVWGEFFGVPKPKIDDWDNLTVEEYCHRVEEDIKINIKLWVKQYEYLKKIYDDPKDIIRIINYLNFKLTCLKIQEEDGILIDVEQCKKNLEFLQGIETEKKSLLEAAMPKIPIVKTVTKPKVMFKKNGSLSVAGEKWFAILEENNIPRDYEGELNITTGYDEPNAGSPTQVKDWLMKLGWKPILFEDGRNGKVPQVRDKEKMLCKSVLALREVEPAIEHLEGLSVVTHRAGYLKGFLEKVDENGYAVAFAHGFTKTLRLKHAKPFVNLPKPTSPYGDLVRGVMIAPEGSILVGSDVSSLEDKMKQISIYPYDPEYVEDMNRPGWDAHLDIGIRSGMISQDESDFFRWYKKKDRKREDLPESFKALSDEQLSEEFEKVTKKRAVAKTVNYACTYGAGVAKIAESSSLPQKDAKKLHTGYWERNWSVKKYAEDQKVKNVEGKSWIWNPITNFYYFLASEKDRFSACNQSAGVRVFDGYVYEMIKRGVRPIFQAHDEVLLRVKKEDVDSTTSALKEAINKVNAQYKFPVEIEIDIQTGMTYADVH
jgi:hypothetical protein